VNRHHPYPSPGNKTWRRDADGVPLLPWPMFDTQKTPGPSTTAPHRLLSIQPAGADVLASIDDADAGTTVNQEMSGLERSLSMTRRLAMTGGPPWGSDTLST